MLGQMSLLHSFLFSVIGDLAMVPRLASNPQAPVVLLPQSLQLCHRPAFLMVSRGMDGPQRADGPVGDGHLCFPGLWTVVNCGTMDAGLLTQEWSEGLEGPR